MPLKPPGEQGGLCSAFANPTLGDKQSCGQDAGRVPSWSKATCFSGIYRSHEGQRSQGANNRISSRPQYIWLGCVQPLLQDECMGPFLHLTCVRSALFWPLSNCCCCFCWVLVCVFFSVLVCVICGWMFCSLRKREEAVWHKISTVKILNHRFTGTTLHTVASRSTPETIEGYRQIYIHSIFPSSHGRFSHFLNFFFRSIFVSSHKTRCWFCVTLYCQLHMAMFLHNHIPHPPNTQQPA